MHKKIKTIQEAQDALDAAYTRKKELEIRLDELNKELSSVKKEHTALTGCGWSRHNGGIEDLINDLETAKLYHKHTTECAPVFWVDDKPPYFHLDEPIPYVITSVGKKQIRVSQAGSNRYDTYTHDGKPVAGYSCQIDIARTFPNGLPVK